MSLTIQQIILDAKRLANRLKEHDSAADALLSQTQSVYKQIDAMKQYQEEVGELNETARQRPHTVLVAGIQQENRHLRELQQENRELRAALEEHQNALELIMSKYRQQVTKLVSSSKQDMTSIHANNNYSKTHHLENLKFYNVIFLYLLSLSKTEHKGGGFIQGRKEYHSLICEQSDKICEMAAVMEQAAETDDKIAFSEQELISKLTTENKGLRELLEISSKFGSLRSSLLKIGAEDKGSQTEVIQDIS
ncbi:FGFR1 oncogene partner 2-like protein [Zootermopsis nevadensis]|uniref:FGFR1 oncogene partner 2-like protein n=1 Tax=Zootermopsis nevadensis TaxID=136037 RepID=A0A067RB74_ZOONE|nr:FGFR1 oncogene partner 2-like protein [Zootermopsis nevadensis]